MSSTITIRSAFGLYIDLHVEWKCRDSVNHIYIMVSRLAGSFVKQFVRKHGFIVRDSGAEHGQENVESKSIISGFEWNAPWLT
jgi:hypothetical protein